MLAPACLSGAAALAGDGSDLEQLLYDRYAEFGGPLVYFHAATDLNGDGRDEIVAHVVGPMVCGTGGCDTLVFTASADPAGGYREVARVSVSRPPVQAAQTSVNGWRNLLVRVAGGGLAESYDAELSFDGDRYPDNPTVPPARRAADAPAAEMLIPAFESMTDGTPLLPR